MGLVTTKVYNLAGDKAPFEAEFLFDTGGMDCMAPASKLKEAGINEESKRLYKSADGTMVKYPVGYARIKFMGDETVAPIIFGPEGTEPILGAIALEGTGIAVDPRTQTLRRLPALSLK